MAAKPDSSFSAAVLGRCYMDQQFGFVLELATQRNLHQIELLQCKASAKTRSRSSSSWFPTVGYGLVLQRRGIFSHL